MSGGEEQLFARGEEFLRLFKRGAEFTRELLRENERLRMRLTQLEQEWESAARTPEDWDKLRHELRNRISSLEEEYEGVRERLQEVEAENRDFAQRYVEVEEENNSLANLYVASYQLHSTLDIDEVLKIVIEIAINLIGAEVFAVYLLDDASGELSPVATEGAEAAAFPRQTLGSGVVGEALAAREILCRDRDAGADPSRPLVCVPLVVQDRPIGVLSIVGLLQQKESFTPLDRELFRMLGGHAATALFAAQLYSQSARKLNAIQGFIDLLTK